MTWYFSVKKYWPLIFTSSDCVERFYIFKYRCEWHSISHADIAVAFDYKGRKINPPAGSVTGMKKLFNCFGYQAEPVVIASLLYHLKLMSTHAWP